MIEEPLLHDIGRPVQVGHLGGQREVVTEIAGPVQHIPLGINER